MEFYILKTIYNNYAKAIRESDTFEKALCPKCGAIHITRTSALHVYFQGKREGDYYNALPYRIISQKFQDVLTREGINGYELKDLVISGWYDSKGKPIQKETDHLKELKVVGKAGKLRKVNGEFVRHCKTCGSIQSEGQKEVNGLSVDLEEWDKAVIFRFENWRGQIIVTDTLKRALEKEKCKNITFQNIKDFTFS